MGKTTEHNTVDLMAIKRDRFGAQEEIIFRSRFPQSYKKRFFKPPDVRFMISDMSFFSNTLLSLGINEGKL